MVHRQRQLCDGASLSTLKNGPVTLTTTETDFAGNQTVRTLNLTKLAETVPAPTVALNASSRHRRSSSDYITYVTTPVFTVTRRGGRGLEHRVRQRGPVQRPGAGARALHGHRDRHRQAGNGSAAATAPKTLVIVTNPPAGSWTVSGGKVINGTLSTKSKTPSLTLSFTDPGGISTMLVSTNGGSTWSAPVAYSSSLAAVLANGDGLYTVEVKITDVAGNTGVYTQTVRLDTTAPTIAASLSTPQQSIGYDGTANITATYSATDISSIGSLSATLDGVSFTGATINIYALTAGTKHTLAVTAVDGLGNASTTTLTFVIHPSLIGVEDAVKAGFAAGAMTSSEQTVLLGYLTNTSNPVKTDLTNFLNAVKAQSGTSSLTKAEATLLTSWAQDLYNRS